MAVLLRQVLWSNQEVIDFENTGWGLPADPFARLVVDYFPLCGDGRNAFYEGYGRDMESECPAQVRIGLVIYALYYKTWAATHDNASLADRARRAFEICRELGST